MLKEFNLGADSRVLDYIRQELSLGKTLARYLLNLPLHLGQVVTYLPPHFTLEMCYEFERTAVIGEWPTTRTLVDQIQTYLQVVETNYALFEDGTGKPTYPAIEKSEHAMFFYGAEVYHWFNKRQVENTDKIYNTIRRIPAYPFIGVLASLLSVDESELQDRQPITEDRLKLFAERTVSIIIGAYDDTGYLIWHRGMKS